MPEFHGLSPLIVWGIFSRLLGLCFLISFTSLYNQVLPIAGEEGVLPARYLLDRVRQDFPGPRRFLYFPTLLWLGTSNGMLRALVLIGLCSALGVVYGGPLSPLLIGSCYAVYLSLDRIIGLAYPWDCVLFEAAFLGMFLPPTHALPDFSALAAPAPLLAWAYRLLPLRVLLGFGKFKFIGSTKDDWGYLKGFLVNQPLASPFGWYLHKAPLPLLKLAMVVMFLVEIPIPFLLAVPGFWGVVAGAAISGLMLGIWACGNFGYFNLVIICLCVTTLDATTVRRLDVSALFDAHGPWLISAIVILHTLGAALAFAFNSFCAQSWVHWTAFLRIRTRLFSLPMSFYRLMQPFRWLHPYGVFPPKALPAVRCIPLIEVTWDGVNWVECHHRFSPTAPTSAPHFIAPHHPRGDQVAVYEGFGLGDSSILHSLLGSGNPYGYTKYSGSHVLLQRILDASCKNYGTVFFAKNTFPPDQPPPIAARVTTHMLTPASHAHRVATGEYWQREYIGPHLPEVRKQEHLWDEMFLPPELWHLEEVIWKRRSRLREINQRLKAGQAVHEAVLAHAPELAPYIERFWGELISRLRATDRSSWESLPDLVESLRAAYDGPTLHAFERLLGRYSFILADKLDPIFFGAGFLPVFGKGHPQLDVKSYLHLAMLFHLIICDGREAFERVQQQPMAAADYTRKLSIANGLYCTAFFRYELFVFEAQKMRLLHTVMEQDRAQFSVADPALTAKMDAIAMRLFGVVEVVPFLRQQFRGPRFERGQPERYPTFKLDPSGVVVRA